MKHRAGAALVLLLLAVVALQGGALRAPFFADDFSFLDQVRDRSFTQALFSPDPLGNYFRPVSRQVYFWIVARLGHESPLVFHLVNFATLLGILAMLFALIRRLAGTRAAVIGAAFVALHYSVDVAVLWVCDSQDLLAVAGALGALLLHLSGRRMWAAVVLMLALLSKEAVVLTPLVAVLIDRRGREPWKTAALRAWPLWLAGALWLAIWFATTDRRPVAGQALNFGPAGPAAALFHFLQVISGLEWGVHGFGRPWQPISLLFPLGLALAAVAWAWGGGARGPAGREPRAKAAAPPATAGPRRAEVAARPMSTARAIGVGIAWAVLGALPVSAVGKYWSAYYYLFALGGIALALGAWLATRPRWVALAALAVLALGSACGRGLEEFSLHRTPWAPMSHINRFALLRGMRHTQRYVPMLLAARPTLPHNSTIYFAGLPSSVSFQQGRGPLVRWVYRDSSLRSYFATDFSIREVRRGPVFLFVARNDSLVEVPQGPDFFRRIAFSMLLNDAAGPARDALTADLERTPASLESNYWLALLEWQSGDRAAAIECLKRARVAAEPGPTAELSPALARLAARDTAGAIQLAVRGVALHGLDPEAHSLLADLTLPILKWRSIGTIEALAARVLAPTEAWAWRRWGQVQVAHGRHEQAVTSFERYLELGGSEARNDVEIQRALSQLRRIVPGGDLAQESLRGGMVDLE